MKKTKKRCFCKPSLGGWEPKLLLLSLALFASIATLFAQSRGTNETLRSIAETKVEEMQSLIGFSNEQAYRLKAVEFQHLKSARKAERCFLCNTQKRIARLQIKRDAALQQILTRAQYIQYDAASDNRIENIPVRL